MSGAEPWGRLEVDVRRVWLIVSLWLVAPAVAAADTPLTEARLHAGYGDLPLVAAAEAGGALTPEILTFLASEAPTDHKAAVVSALGWRSPGITHGRAFMEHLAVNQGLTVSQLTLSRLRAVDVFVLGYLVAMDDPHELRPLDPSASGPLSAPPWELLSIAANALPGDFTVQLTRALIEGQRDTASAWCSVYLEGHQVLERFPASSRNLRPEAVQQVEDALSGYASACGEPRVSPGAPKAPRVDVPPAATAGPTVPAKPELNQIYAVTRYRDTIVTATQGGIVLWDRAQKRAIAAHLEPICVDLVVYKDALWVGCQHAVVRYDGSSWKTYLKDAASVDAYKPRLAPGGLLVVAHGEALFQYRAEFDAFSAAPDALGSGEGYDLLWDDEGVRWRVRFMESVDRGDVSMAVRSAAYPGADPRGLYVDAGGGVWVIDFADGFYRYDDTRGHFFRVPGVAARGSDVAVDADRERVWLLHYTDGVYLRTGSGPARFFDLSRLLYLRDLFVDVDGDLWVAGWNELLRLKEEGGQWSMEDWRIE